LGVEKKAWFYFLQFLSFFYFLVYFIIYVYEIEWKIIKEENYIEFISRISHKLKTVEHQSTTPHTLLDYSISV